MIYFSGVANAQVAAVAKQYDIGLIVQPGHSLHLQLDRYPHWAADNGCFKQGPAFREDKFFIWLDKLPRTATFVVCPDIPFDAEGTLELGKILMPTIRYMGFKVAFAAQNGIENLEIPWRMFDCLFIAGDTEWKLSDTARDVSWEAARRGKWIHMGRVNSLTRIERARTMKCNSVDGTFLKYAPTENIGRMQRWLKQRSMFDAWREREHAQSKSGLAS